MIQTKTAPKISAPLQDKFHTVIPIKNRTISPMENNKILLIFNSNPRIIDHLRTISPKIHNITRIAIIRKNIRTTIFSLNIFAIRN